MLDKLNFENILRQNKIYQFYILEFIEFTSKKAIFSANIITRVRIKTRIS